MAKPYSRCLGGTPVAFVCGALTFSLCVGVGCSGDSSGGTSKSQPGGSSGGGGSAPSLPLAEAGSAAVARVASAGDVGGPSGSTFAVGPTGGSRTEHAGSPSLAIPLGGSASGVAAGASGVAGLGGASAASAGSSSGSVAAKAVDCLHDGDQKTTLAFVNGCSKTLTFAGSDIKGGSVEPGAFACIEIGSATDTLSSKRYWGYVGQDPGGGKVSLAEFTFNTDFNDFDWYNISFVDAFNLPIQILPVARTSCKPLTCAADFLANCPEAGRYRGTSSEVIACVSPARDDGNSPVARYFEGCDDAYAWSADDANGSDPSPMRACAGEDWQITFCPKGVS